MRRGPYQNLRQQTKSHLYKKKRPNIFESLRRIACGATVPKASALLPLVVSFNPHINPLSPSFENEVTDELRG